MPAAGRDEQQPRYDQSPPAARRCRTRAAALAVARARIVARAAGGKRWGSGDATTADDGSFEMKAVRPGALRIVAQRGWSNDMRAPGTTDDDVQGERVQVVAGEVATVELVVEEQFGKITGKIVDADGAPVDDAFVHTTRESDSAAANEKGSRANVRWGQWNRTPSLTEQDGSFALDELEIGKHTVMAMRKGGGEGVVEHVETGATGVVITLAEGGSIAGKVALSSGGAPKRFTVSLEERSQGVWRSIDPAVDVFDREAVFVRETLPRLVSRHPRLRIVLEHVSTAEAVEWVAAAPEHVAATITAHHLLFDRNAMFAGGIRPHMYCLPVLKRAHHREALVAAATSGNPKFFLGTDSAPHARPTKESACGCAGTFTAHAALELYATAFERAGALARLPDFASRFGPRFYGLPVATTTTVLERRPWTVPATYPMADGELVPLAAGEPLAWRQLG